MSRQIPTILRNSATIYSNSHQNSGRNERVVLPGSGGSFRKGAEFLLVSLARGLGSGSGGWLPLGSQGKKGKGLGRAGGVGTYKGTGKSMRMRLSKRLFSRLLFSFSPRNGTDL